MGLVRADAPTRQSSNVLLLTLILRYLLYLQPHCLIARLQHLQGLYQIISIRDIY
jgi:hypothetical protein